LGGLCPPLITRPTFTNKISNYHFLQILGQMTQNYKFPLKLLNRSSIILNSNQFEGKIPLFLLQAAELRLSNNKVSDLFSFICDQNTSATKILDLSNNQLKGQLPNGWKTVDGLLYLDLSKNKLSGKIPVSMGSLVNLEVLVLRNNKLMGELVSTLKNCSNLMMLDVGENMLSGPIPSWIMDRRKYAAVGNLEHASTTKKTHFESSRIPFSLSQIVLGKLDLSHNGFSGRIPSGRHFETFNVSSFEGNAGLCGEQLNKTCPGNGNQTTIKPVEHGTVNTDEDYVFLWDIVHDHGHRILYWILGLIRVNSTLASIEKLLREVPQQIDRLYNPTILVNGAKCCRGLVCRRKVYSYVLPST